MIDQSLKQRIVMKKGRLDALRPLSSEVLGSLRKFHDVELTYTSNALEGNTLTHRETAEVIEHGITVGGKTLREHLEAVDHYEALRWMRTLVDSGTPLSESLVCALHQRIVARSQPEIAGFYSAHPRRIAGSPVIFPNPMKIPALMREFGLWLEQVEPSPEAAFASHLRLTSIHPFGDGNGRTARLLMNLILLRGGYPPIPVRPVDRKGYLDHLESASLTGAAGPFETFMLTRLEATLDDYLGLVEEATRRERLDHPS